MNQGEFEFEYARARRWRDKMKPLMLKYRDSRQIKKREKIRRIWKIVYRRYIDVMLTKNESGKYFVVELNLE